MTKTTNTMMPVLERAEDKPAPIAPVNDEQAFILQLATNPAVDVAKLQAILDMRNQERNRLAREAFNRAFTTMQPLLPVIDEKAKTDKTTYAPLEDIVEQVRPICQTHGFSFGWESKFPENGAIVVICTLTHVDGHERTSEFVAAPDQTGSKNAIQARASAVTYGQRYTLKSLLGIVTRHEDDDAERSSGSEGPPRPKDYDDKIDDLSAAADEGFARFSEAWKHLDSRYRDYANAMDLPRMGRIKQKALDVDRKNGVKR